MQRRHNAFQMGVVRYRCLQAKFNEFVQICVEELNENEFLPGVSFEKQDDHTGLLRAFGQKFHIRFEMFAHHGQHPKDLAVLEASLVVGQGIQQSSQLLMRRYFDELGNVMSTLSGSWDSFNPLDHKGFLINLLNDLATIYFSNVEQRCISAEDTE